MHPDEDTLLPEEHSKNSRMGSGFAVRLTRKRLLSLPDSVYLLSNRSDNPPNSVLEIRITKETSRQSLWESIVRLRLNGRTFMVFPDDDSLRIEKNERLKATPTSNCVH